MKSQSSVLRWLGLPMLMVVAVVMANCSIMLVSPFISSALDVVVSTMQASSKFISSALDVEVSTMQASSKWTYVPLFLLWKRTVRRRDPTFQTVASLPWFLLVPAMVIVSPTEKMSEGTCSVVFMVPSNVIY
jgi:hypothetical protein